MRITQSQLEHYVELLNGLLDPECQIMVKKTNSYFKLVSKDSLTDYCPYGMTCRECYYVVVTMFNMEVAKMRYKSTREDR